ncbi:hypothetical protein L1987_08565 [Smallanthus sonchifolius]|uniref:Uncharacterized protein n=1 Tax=Smallanthus sonchifolius TaxID=185202 RepID=A0ACB9JL12_9ASTR|nr:hypothetical protein L1987_08565 [Smallanthus sonchifolius]
MEVMQRHLQETNHDIRATREEVRRATREKGLCEICEIYPFALSCCDETISAAITTLSAGDLMAYLDYIGPPDDLVHLVRMRLQERNLTWMLDLMDDYYNPSSSSSCD